jgi:hypothetical protein
MRSTVSTHRPSITTRTGSPLERAYAYLRVARTTEAPVDFLGALTGAMEEASRCHPSEAAMVRDAVAGIQYERGPRLVPEQLGRSRREVDEAATAAEAAADAAETL